MLKRVLHAPTPRLSLCRACLTGSSAQDVVPLCPLKVFICLNRRASRRLFMLDYDGTLLAQSSINPKPGEDVLAVLRALTEDKRNTVFIVSGRGRAELGSWFQSVVRGSS